MSWIEGVGDEVTITFAVVLGFFIILLAWFSTGIRDIPFISVIIVHLTRRRVRLQNDAQAVAQPEASDSTVNETQSETSPLEEVPVTSQALETNTDSATPEAKRETNERENSHVEDNAANNANSEEDIGHQHIEDIATVPTKINEESGSNVIKRSTSSGLATEPSQPNTDGTIALSEQELRQRRLEFFINGSSNKLEHETVEATQLEECSDKTQVNSSVEPLSPVAQDLPTSDAGSSPDPSQNRTQETAENQPNTERADEIRVRIKFFNDEQRLVTCSPMDTIGTFRRTHFSTELSESKLVRFIFNGQDLRNDMSTLQSYNIMDNSVLHCLVTQPPPASHSPTDDDDGFDIGMFMFPLFGLLLGIVWYMRLMYRQFFNVTSTLTLGGITFLYLAAFISSLRRQRHEHLD